MGFNIFKTLGLASSLFAAGSKLWYAIKKDVPRVICPGCEGKGKVWIYARPDKTPDPLDTLNTCPLCKGEGKIRKTEIPEKI